MLNRYSKPSLVAAITLAAMSLFYLFFVYEFDGTVAFYLDNFFSGSRFWYLIAPLSSILLTLFLKKEKGSPIQKLIPLFPFLISLTFLTFFNLDYFSPVAIPFYFISVIFTALYIVKPSQFISTQFTSLRFKLIIFSLFFLQLTFFISELWGLVEWVGLVFYSIKESIPWLGSLLLIGLIIGQSPSPSSNKNSKHQPSDQTFKNNTVVSSLLDPKNPLWLEILRYTVIIWSSLVFVSTFLFLIIYLSNWNGLNFLVLVGSLIVSIVLAFLNLTLGMISLNLLFNIQAIRVSLEKTNK